jgi:hypothetical protein
LRDRKACNSVDFPVFGPFVRLAAAALALGTAAGLAAAGDISSSKRAGRIATPQAPPAPVEPGFAQPDDPALAQAHGFALAAQLKVRRPADCRAVSAEFRSGCLDYVEGAPVRAEDAQDLL